MKAGKGIAKRKDHTQKKQSEEVDGHQKSGTSDKVRITAILLLMVVVGIIHRYHVAYMFENSRHFSYLSDLEREMTFRTEMGFYYSFFKTMNKAPTFLAGLFQILHDNQTEFGHTINDLKRFNVYPEVMLSAMYRIFQQVTKKLGIETETCWTTVRGEGAAPVLSCEGIGNPFYFYVNFVFVLAGSEASALFLYGLLLSDSILGGILTVATFFFNHSDATRIQWTPTLRESFGYPLFLWQMLLISYILKYKPKRRIWFVSLSILTCCFMASWQFASFALSTQVGCIFLIYCFDYLKPDLMKRISLAVLLGFFAAFVLLFGNEMLLSSLLFSSLLAAQVVLHVEPLVKLSSRFFVWCFKVLLFSVVAVVVKVLIGFVFNIRDDAHIFDILKSKFTNFSTFHTRLYTCAAEFDFLEYKTLVDLSQSLLIPLAILCILFSIILFLRIELGRLKGLSPDQFGSFSECWYNILQLGCFALMALLIMRLKLFFTPHLCIIVSLLANKTLLRAAVSLNVRQRYIYSFCVLVLSLMAIKGRQNLQNQWSISGEYSNFPLERLFQWIVMNTKADDVFAGSMPLMANLKLSTERPIVIHPHYEDAELRDRVMKVYSVFSRKPLNEVYRLLKDLKVNYVIFESVWCKKSARPGCTMPELFDLHDVRNAGGIPSCDLLMSDNTDPFKLVYETDVYRVFKIA